MTTLDRADLLEFLKDESEIPADLGMSCPGDDDGPDTGDWQFAEIRTRGFAAPDTMVGIAGYHVVSQIEVI